MYTLITCPNFEFADDFYAALLAAHDGLSEAETHAFNARLILILGNHVGTQNILVEALDAAAKR